MKLTWMVCALSFVCVVPMATQCYAQETKAYYLDGDEVVFVFDIRDYQEATREKSQERLDFEDIDIYKVAVTGEFTRWSRKGWEMKKVGEYTYQLRKRLSDFRTAFPISFKYIINEEYWAEPGSTFPTVRKFSDEFIGETYNLTLYDVLPAVEGNTFFFLEGYTGAKEVILTGSFVGWDEQYLKMTRVEDGWAMRLDLRPDRHEYKFIVDGEWVRDPGNPDMVENQHGTFNSVLRISRVVQFELEGYADAERVDLVGSWNNWGRVPMTLKDGRWVFGVDLPGGKYHYKFVVEGRFITDPANPQVETNKRSGTSASVLIVQ